MHRVLLLTVLLSAALAAGQSPAPSPQAPTPQPAADPQSMPDPQQPADDQPHKKSLGKRIKDQITDPWCIHVAGSGCHDVAPKKKTQDDSGQPEDTQQKQPGPGKNAPTPRSDAPSHDGEFSSSRDTIIDLTPPKDDLKKHPNSSTNPDDDVEEFHKYDPHRAAKDVEVGDFYFRRQSYSAALSRYQEALEFKPNDAIATFRLAETEEKLQQVDDAREHYGAYLRILPNGPYAEDARKALERLGAPVPPAPVSESQQVPHGDTNSPHQGVGQHLKQQLSDFCITTVFRNCPAKAPEPKQN